MIFVREASENIYFFLFTSTFIVAIWSRHWRVPTKYWRAVTKNTHECIGRWRWHHGTAFLKDARRCTEPKEAFTVIPQLNHRLRKGVNNQGGTKTGYVWSYLTRDWVEAARTTPQTVVCMPRQMKRKTITTFYVLATIKRMKRCLYNLHVS